MSNASRNYLPLEYQPSSFDIICGRGPACFNHPGNVAFRQVIEKYLDRYEVATNKVEKTKIVSEVASEALHSDDSIYKVVRWCRIRKLWFEIPEIIFRQKIGQTMRDTLLMRDPQKRAIKKEKRAFQRIYRENDASPTDNSFGLLEKLIHNDSSSSMMNRLNGNKCDDFDGFRTERLDAASSQVQRRFILPTHFNILEGRSESSETGLESTNNCWRLNNEIFGRCFLNSDALSLIPNSQTEASSCKMPQKSNEGEMFIGDDESDICSADWFGDGDIFTDL
jgi:hypothetical protein